MDRFQYILVTKDEEAVKLFQPLFEDNLMIERDFHRVTDIVNDGTVNGAVFFDYALLFNKNENGDFELDLFIRCARANGVKLVCLVNDLEKPVIKQVLDEVFDVICTKTYPGTFAKKIQNVRRYTLMKKMVDESEAIKNVNKVAQMVESQPVSITKKERKAFNFVGKCILVVEDNELSLEVATTVLSQTGAVIETAKNGLEALSRFKASSVGKYDLILMDLRMPAMGGSEATREIRNTGREDSKLPIIALTSIYKKEEHDEAISSGMDDILMKPLNIKELKTTLETI